ncbi:hypothetical protein ACF0H5_002496 [Mactra antiquata]
MKEILLIFSIFLVTPSHALFSKWLKNTDLNNPSNWDRGNLPCGNDRMILPDDGPIVFMQLNTTIQELVLPRDVELVFGSYATLGFTNDPDHSAACLDSGTDITFNASHPADWIDPNNWCPTDTEKGPCKTLPQLDSERIPCITDDVIFPTGSSYYVNLGSKLNIEINTLKVSGQAFSTPSFQNFLASEKGGDIFPVPATGSRSSVNILRRRCNDPTGCGCGNDQGQILSAICQVQSVRCNRPRCKYPITPVGHCCGICGGMLNITYGTGFNLANLKNGIQRNFLYGKEAYSNVQYIVSKRSDNKIQMVLQDNDGKISSGVAMTIYNELKSDIANGGYKYGITDVRVQTAAGGGSTFDGKTSAHTGTRSMAGGSVAGITIGVLLGVIIIICIGYYIYINRNSQTSDDGTGFTAQVFNQFNRFNVSQKRKPQVSVPPSIGYTWGSHDSGVSSVSGQTSQGFENPIYGSVALQDMKPIELEPTDFAMMTDTQPVNQGFDNPLYDTDHQESLFGDPTVVENPELPTVMTLGPSNQDTDA